MWILVNITIYILAYMNAVKHYYNLQRFNRKKVTIFLPPLAVQSTM